MSDTTVVPPTPAKPGLFDQLKSGIQAVAKTVAKPFQKAAPSVATDSGVERALDVTPEGAGRTMTGGRKMRHRKTHRRGGKKQAKKTRKH